MIKIGICDDEEIYRNILEEYCKSFVKKCNMDIEIFLFRSAKELIENRNLDVLLLDIELKDGNGIEIKNEYQRDRIHTKVIFVTTYSEVMPEAFGKNVYGFLEKPITESDVHSVLKNIIREIQEDEEYIVIENSQRARKIFLHQIMYIRAEGKFSIIVLKEEKIFSDKNISYWDEKFKNQFFIRSHRSNLVNLRNIERIKRGEIIVNNEQVKMSRYCEKEVREAFHQYLVQRAVVI